MLCFESLKAAPLPPKLIPTFKQPERQLLSVFMSLLEASPIFRGRFLAQCEYRSGKTCTFASTMEPQYPKGKFPEVRPDGLIAGTRGSTDWSGFVEAKANKNEIRAEQIQNYLELAKALQVDCVITISNEFARLPTDPPYFIAAKYKRNAKLFHFAWADIRTLLTFVLADEDLDSCERYILQQASNFMWDEKSGILTYDAMPENWKDFVEAAGTALGFSQNQKGLADIVHGWQQERRDLASKLANQSLQDVQLRHLAGAHVDEETRHKADRKLLADEYRLSAVYYFKETRTRLDVLVALRSCRLETAVEITLPDGPAAKGTVSWLHRKLSDAGLNDAIIAIDWPGFSDDTTMSVADFLEGHDQVSEGQKSAPKGAKLIFGKQQTRRFKSRKFFVQDLEWLVLDAVGRTRQSGLIGG